MINLVNTSLYSFNKTYDYQSVCDPEKDSKAAAGPRSAYVVRRSTFWYSVVDLIWRRTLVFNCFLHVLSFSSLPLQTCSVLAGGHQVLPGEGAVSVLCLYMCVLGWEDLFLFYCNVFVWKWTTGEEQLHNSPSLFIDSSMCVFTSHSPWLGRYCSSF